MPSDDFSNSLSSEVYTLKAEGGKTFHIHSNFLKKYTYFRSLIISDTKESAERIIPLVDWDDDTVGRFVEFLYTEDYRYPDPTPVEHGEIVREGEVGGERRNQRGRPRNVMLGQGQALMLLDQYLGPSLHKEKKGDDGEVRLKQFELSDHGHDYGVVLLAHAKVYAFAQHKGITALQAMSLERLQITLVSISSIRSGWHYGITVNIVQLLEYVYSHTNSPKQSEEPMRRVVLQFAALNFQDLQTKEMGKLMSDGGDLVKDLMEEVCKIFVVTDENFIHPEHFTKKRGCK